MLQVNLVKPRELKLEEVNKPEPGRGEVLIKVNKVGICGSDIHAFKGEHPFISTPIVMGHEFSGDIVGTGEGVSDDDFSVGKKVTVEPSLVCGECVNCRRGRYNICINLKVIGCQSDGAFAEYISVPQEKVILVDEDMSYEDAAMLEPLAVAVHAADRGIVSHGNKSLVIGSGTIGLLLTQVLKGRGEDVCVIDILDKRLNMADDLGATEVLNPQTDDFAEKLKKFAPEGFDVIYECAGNPVTVRQAVDLARKGTKVVQVGVIGDEVTLPVGLIQDGEIDYIGDLMYMKDDFQRARKLVRENTVNLSPLLSKNFPLKEAGKAFDYIFSNKEEALKVILDV